MVDSGYFVKSTPLRAFSGYFQQICYRHMEVCMKKFDAEIFFFIVKLNRVFNLAIFE